MKKELNNKPIVNIFVITILLSFALWFVGFVLFNRISYQPNLFFLRMSNFLADFTNVVGYSATRDPYNSLAYTGLQEKAYPPLCYVLMYAFSRIVNIEPYYEANFFLNMYTEPPFLMAFMVFTFITIVIIYEMIKNLKTGSNNLKALVSLSFIVSSPFLFSIERGNLVLLTFMLVMFYVAFYDSDNKILKELALIALALAAALKLSPACFGVLLLREKRWKESIRVVIYGIIFGFGPFLLLKGGLANIPLFIRNIGLQMEAYKYNEGLTVLSFFMHYLRIEVSEPLILVSKAITYILTAMLLVIIFISEKKWIQLLCTALIIIILPGHSEYYNILFLFPAFVLFLNKEKYNFFDILLFISILIILFDFQTIIKILINYHLGMLLMIIYSIYLFAQSIKTIKAKKQV